MPGLASKFAEPSSKLRAEPGAGKRTFGIEALDDRVELIHLARFEVIVELALLALASSHWPKTVLLGLSDLACL
jgi:hypothetical protein